MSAQGVADSAPLPLNLRSFYRVAQVWALQVMIHVSNGNYTDRVSL